VTVRGRGPGYRRRHTSSGTGTHLATGTRLATGIVTRLATGIVTPSGSDSRRSTKPAAVLLAAAVVATVLAGCSAPAPSSTAMTLVPVTGGSITVGIDQPPQGCNPSTPSGDSWADQFVLEPVLPSAFVVSNTGQPVGNGEVVSSAELINAPPTSPQTVQYTINPKAVWSDGVPVTASDFVYAWQQQRGATGNAANISGYRDITSVTGSNGGRTVTVVFATPFTDWRLLFSDLMPAHVMERVGWDPDCSTIDPTIDLSAGPFMVHAVDPGHEVQLVRNPRWWGPPASVQHLNIRIATGPAQLSSWLGSGAIAVAEPSSFGQGFLAGLSSRPTLSTTVGLSSTFLQLEFSMTGPDTALTAVRQAIAHAIDRQALIDDTVGWADSSIVPATSHIWSQAQGQFPGGNTSPNLPNALDAGNQPTTTTTTTPTPNAASPFPSGATPADTDRLLSSAGYTLTPAGQWLTPEGTPLTLRLAADMGDGWAAETVDPLVKQLEHSGFTVRVLPEPTATTTGMALAGGLADLALLPMASTPYNSQTIAWYTTLLGLPGKNGSEDWSNFDSPALENLLTRAVRQLNPVTGAPYYQQADQLLWSEMVALPLFDEPSLLATSDSVSGVGPNTNGPGLLWYPVTWQVQSLEPVKSTTPTS
jgi:peptide/nickel transport system substrate-binding protein